MSRRINELKDAIEHGHKCRATHARSVPVTEMFGQKLVWEGIVEVFDLVGHPQTKCCYGWFYSMNGLRQYVTVLRLPPVDSPHAAVRAAIASGQQK